MLTRMIVKVLSERFAANFPATDERYFPNARLTR